MFNSFIETIVGYLSVPLLAVASLFGINAEPAPVGVSLPSGTAVFETSLATGITAAASSMTLASNSVRGGGSLSGYQCFTIDEGSAQAEYVCGTVSGTAVSSLERGILPSDGVSTSTTLAFAHRRGASVKITDFPLIQRLKAIANGEQDYPSTTAYASAVSIATSSTDIPYASWVQNAITSQAVLVTGNQSVAGNKSFSGDIVVSGTSTIATSTIASTTINFGRVLQTPTNGTDIANKTYVDGVALAGAPDATESVKGVVEEATLAEIKAGTATGGTGANLFVSPDKLQTYAAVSSTFSSSTALYQDQAISMDADDILMVWGSSNIANTGVTCAGAATQSLTLQKKSSTLGASTTEAFVGGSNNQGCSLNAFFIHTATTSETMRVSITVVDGLARTPTNSLMTQLIKR